MRYARGVKIFLVRLPPIAVVPCRWDKAGMRPRPCLAILTMLAAAFGLNGCAYIYDVEARVIGGRLAFVPSDDDFECVDSARVTTDEDVRPEPGPADSSGLVRNAGAFWWVNYPVSCEVSFPLLYGQRSIGGEEPVRARPLRVGVVYDVSTSGDGGYGTGRFRITPDRRVENLPHEGES